MNKKEIIMTIKNLKKYVGVHITTSHREKMDGMQSLSTSCMCNPFCEVYSKDPKKVCSKCYAKKQMNYMTGMQKCFKNNTEILANQLLLKENLPVINASFFRFEAFGDIQSVIQVVNYFNICKANKYTHFALWTKNPFLIEEAIKEGYKKPSNLQIILSSHYINVPVDPSRWDFVDKTFTVYDKKYIKEHDVTINCGAKNCLACKKCYLKGKDIEIREKLK